MITMILFGNRIRSVLLSFLITLIVSNGHTLENKILFTIDNEIITSIDLLQEKNYLTSLNKNLQNLDANRLNLVARDSLIREKIKKLEILNFTNKIEPNKNVVDDLIKSIYLRLGLKSEKEFIKYIEIFNINLEEIRKKIAIESLWNELIFLKFSNKVKINKTKFEKIVNNKNYSEIKSYLFSEILFNASSKEDYKNKLENIKKTINDNSFENAAVVYSIADSAKFGGKLAWIKEESLNAEISNKIKNLKIGDYSDTILTPGGFLILKIEDAKIEKRKIDVNTEMQSLIKNETNKQLNQFSNIYYNKIKKNFEVNEF